MRKGNKIIIIAISLILFLFFTMCGYPYCKKYTLNEGELSWLGCYKDNDTLFFYCKENHSVDTAIINKVTVHNPVTRIPIPEDFGWLEGDHIYKGVGTIEFTLKHNSIEYPCVLTIIKEQNNVAAFFDIAFCGNYLIERIELPQPKESNFKKNKQTNDSIVDIHENQLEKGQFQNILPINRILWSQNFGLSKYSVNDNIFTLLVKE